MAGVLVFFPLAPIANAFDSRRLKMVHLESGRSGWSADLPDWIFLPTGRIRDTM